MGRIRTEIEHRARCACGSPLPSVPVIATFHTYDHREGYTTATCDAIPDATGSGKNAHEAIGALLCRSRVGLAAQIAVHCDSDEDGNG
jgi:hypothetical protein